VPTYHIADAECLASGQAIRHRPVNLAKGSATEIESAAWLPGGPISIGLTAGASTPNAIVGRVVQRLADIAAGSDHPAGPGVNSPDHSNVTP